MIKLSDMKKALEDAFQSATVEVNDMTGTGDHFQALIVTPDFTGLSRIERHQKVYAALKGDRFETLHALTMKTFTPEEYEKEK